MDRQADRWQSSLPVGWGSPWVGRAGGEEDTALPPAGSPGRSGQDFITEGAQPAPAAPDTRTRRRLDSPCGGPDPSSAFTAAARPCPRPRGRRSELRVRGHSFSGGREGASRASQALSPGRPARGRCHPSPGRGAQTPARWLLPGHQGTRAERSGSGCLPLSSLRGHSRASVTHVGRPDEGSVCHRRGPALLLCPCPLSLSAAGNRVPKPAPPEGAVWPPPPAYPGASWADPPMGQVPREEGLRVQRRQGSAALGREAAGGGAGRAGRPRTLWAEGKRGPSQGARAGPRASVLPATAAWT